MNTIRKQRVLTFMVARHGGGRHHGECLLCDGQERFRKQRVLHAPLSRFSRSEFGVYLRPVEFFGFQMVIRVKIDMWPNSGKVFWKKSAASASQATT